MDEYQVAFTGSEFQVIANHPDGRCDTVSGFRTECDARSWLDGFLVLLALIDCMASEPGRRQNGVNQNA